MIKNDIRDLQLPREKLNGIYRGVVEDNVDPNQAGRCRIRIFGVHSPNKDKDNIDGIPTEELPWAEPVLGLIEGSISGCGLFGVPLQGSHVFVFFENGNILYPRYFGTAPGIPSSEPVPDEGFNDPEGKYPTKASIGHPDWNSGNGEYPHNVVLSVHGGHYIEIDSTPNKERIKVCHKTGTYIEINESGHITINCSKKEITVSGDVNMNVSGKCNIKCSNVNIGDGPYKEVLHKEFINAFNNHSHDGGGPPTPITNIASVATQHVKLS